MVLHIQPPISNQLTPEANSLNRKDDQVANLANLEDRGSFNIYHPEIYRDEVSSFQEWTHQEVAAITKHHSEIGDPDDIKTNDNQSEEFFHPTPIESLDTGELNLEWGHVTASHENLLTLLSHQSVETVVQTLTEKLKRREIDPTAIEMVLRRLNMEGVIAKSEQVFHYAEVTSPAELKKQNRALIQYMDTHDEEGNERAPGQDFAAFAHKVKHAIFEYVATGHPTYTHPKRVHDIMQFLILNRGNLAPQDKMQVANELFHTDYGPETQITLDREFELKLNSASNLRFGLHEFKREVLAYGKEFYPNNYHELLPIMAIFASWVAADTDGRTDVSFIRSWQFMCKSKLRFLADSLTFLSTNLEDSEVFTMLEHEHTQLTIDVGDGEFDEQVLADTEGRLHSYKQVYAECEILLQTLLQNPSENEAKIDDLIIFMSDLEGFGLMAARVHFRINAAKMRTKQNDTDNGIDMRIMQNINDCIAAQEQGVTDENQLYLDYLSLTKLDNEAIQYAGINMFRTMREVKERVSDAPIVFLMAETHRSDEIINAIKMARAMGMEKDIIIAPLIEDTDGVKQYDQILDELLADPIACAYYEGIMSLPVQLGMSDGSRFFGALGMAEYFERMVMRAKIKKIKSSGFNWACNYFTTGGEKFDRGKHPDSLKDCVNYNISPRVRAEMPTNSITKLAFQGGDALPYSWSVHMAQTTLLRVLEVLLGPQPDHENDAFYHEDYADIREKFFGVIREFSNNLMTTNSEPYAKLLYLIGTTNSPTGSRALKRSQASDGKAGTNRAEMAKTRSIGQATRNEMLGGVSPTTLGGVGQAFEKFNTDGRVTELLSQSPQFQLMMKGVYRAFQYANKEVLKAKVASCDPDAPHNQHDPSTQKLLQEYSPITDIKNTPIIDNNQEVVAPNIIEHIITIYDKIEVMFKELADVTNEQGQPIFIPENPIFPPRSQANLELAHTLQTALIRYHHHLIGNHQQALEFSHDNSIGNAQEISNMLHLTNWAQVNKLREEKISQGNALPKIGPINGSVEAYKEQLYALEYLISLAATACASFGFNRG